MIELLESRLLLSAALLPLGGLVHTTAQLSRARLAMASTSVGDYAIFAGGDGRLGYSAAVDLYNSKTGAWSTARLSQARDSIAGATVGHFALFAGGFNDVVGSSDVVDIFDSDTGVWSTARLSEPSDNDAVAVVGNVAIFAGGGDDQRSVDIFDASTGVWSKGQLSRGRSYIAAAVVGDLAIFAGGYFVAQEYPGGAALEGLDDVDIYNARTSVWSTATISQARGQIASATSGDLAIFAGGDEGSATSTTGPASSVVDVFNNRTGQWSTAMLSQPRVGLTVATARGVALFAGGDTTLGGSFSDAVDIYHPANGHWSTATLPEGLYFPAASALGNDIIIAGGGGGVGESDAAAVYDVRSGALSAGKLAQARGEIAAATVGHTAIFAGGTVNGRHGGSPVTNVVDLFTYDDTAPSALLAAKLPPLSKTRTAYTFSIAYHDESRIDADSLGNDNVIVTGPEGFSQRAALVAVARGKSESTRIATYAIDGPGRRWDNSDNGDYEVHLQDGQVTDVVGNAAAGRRIGAFAVAIATAPSSFEPAASVASTVFQMKRKIDPLLGIY